MEKNKITVSYKDESIHLDIKGDQQIFYPLYGKDWKTHLKNFIETLQKALDGKRISALY